MVLENNLLFGGEWGDTLGDLKEGLQPEYIYELKCQDCPRKFEYRSNHILTEAQIKKGGICSNCWDDYK